MPETKTLPPTETVVIGGTFPGIAAALRQARAGTAVTLVEARTYLGTEINATLRPWLPAADEYPELLEACLEASESQPLLGEYPLHPDAVKKRLERLLVDAGVQILYACSPVELVEGALLIGSKGGIFRIPCQRVLDARPNPLDPGGAVDPGWLAISLEFEGAAFAEYGNQSEMPTEIAVPEKLGMVGNRLLLHRGCRRSPNPYLRSHVLVECRMDLPLFDDNPLGYTARYLAARRKALAAAEHLLWEHPAFRLAWLGKVSEALHDPQTAGDLFSPPPALRLVSEIARIDMSADEWDVIVVGGGTSGAIAAIAAAEEGARTLIVEMNPGLGGTGTYGGVSAYWMGRQVGFSKRSQGWTDALHDRLRYPHMQGSLPVWNIEAKTQALLEQAQSTGVDLLIETQVVDAVVQSGRLVGVSAATPLGLTELHGKVFIDATGDGDVAAFAGAETAYGARRDGRVMWYSLPQFKSPGRIQSNFSGMLDLTDPLDFSRAVRWGRVRGGALHDHGSYLAPRETRRIHGRTTQSLADQMLGRAYPDVVSIAMSNNDMKGHTSADWMQAGLVPPNLEIEIAYRMLLPKDLNGLLVVGKAISADRDALPAIRMQPDMENLGGAAGIAAAFAVRQGADVSDVDLAPVQARLVEMGVLPPDVLERSLAPFRPTAADVRSWLEEIVSDERPLWALSSMAVDAAYPAPVPFAALCCSGPQAVAAVEAALARNPSSETRRKLGRALALMGAISAVTVLVEELERDLASGALPTLQGVVQHAKKEAPDQAAMPETAYLLYALGLTGDRRALPIWARVVDLLEGAALEDVFSTRRGVFAYVDAVCSGAERLGDPAAVPILEKLAGFPALRGHRRIHPNPPAGTHADYLHERAAYLELVVARALARCGGSKGALTLIGYLDDSRKLLSKHAHQELIAISGQDYGYDMAAWGAWLENAGDSLQPLPWTAALEAVAAWEDDILVAEK